MSGSAGAAPDVDLKSRGLPHHVIFTGAAFILGVAVVFTRNRSPEVDDAVDDGELAAAQAGVLSWLVWTFMRIAQMIACLFGILLAVLISRQRSILYVPIPPGTQRSPKDNPPMYRSPEAWRLPFENVTIVAEDGTRLHAWFVYQEKLGSSAEDIPYTLLYFHGNAGNIGHRLENVKEMHRMLGVNILILDYRGYGDSEDGSGPSEDGFLKDAMGAYRWLVGQSRGEAEKAARPRVRSDRILFFGRSIGGAVAVRLAERLLRERREQALFGKTAEGAELLPLPAGLVLENTFTSLRDMAVQIFPFLSFLRPLLRSPVIFDEWRSSDGLDYLASNHDQWCCCLLSGLQDQIVPPEQMRAIHAILKKNRPKVLKFFVFPHGGHNDTPHKGGAEYWSSFQKYMDLVRSTEQERNEASTSS
eukprot:TRINITY_DN112763_c0_g1_i1.p1 TRINITY_DN112763_c0_g1~~TRINITY_DN112763_c0_g1_i1.p1  ORF type:complete len:417 (+),score=53.94 TRINITY_DN112763_c0_g1_i1:83-1333(+)